MKKHTLMVIAFSFVSIAAFSQAADEAKIPHYKYAIGIGAGFSTGYGLSFRYTPSKFGLQANFAPYYSETVKTYSGGITFLYTLIEARTTNLFIYQGNHYYSNSTVEYRDTVSQIYYSSDPDLPNVVKEKTTESYFNNGIGFGIEIIIAKRIGFNLMAGYGFYVNFTQVNVTGEAGLYYKF